MNGWFGLRLEGRTSKDPRPASRGDRATRSRVATSGALDYVDFMPQASPCSLTLTSFLFLRHWTLEKQCLETI
jgi:hypothetical protein